MLIYITSIDFQLLLVVQLTKNFLIYQKTLMLKHNFITSFGLLKLLKLCLNDETSWVKQ